MGELSLRLADRARQHGVTAGIVCSRRSQSRYVRLNGSVVIRLSNHVRLEPSWHHCDLDVVIKHPNFIEAEMAKAIEFIDRTYG